ncbi:hypothetical protein [Streptomyces sp. A1547]|uniref:hypothetical protein n=1 Tax=Streptomyces sp. A1547 TaxID=2563105 RepID=UPI00109EC560|nr:hypothetical protein [Streptomyces sp. A1547]THA40177.1 hypothetical protein E6W17_07805 [Streptomyces sp. A1547]
MPPIGAIATTANTLADEGDDDPGRHPGAHEGKREAAPDGLAAVMVSVRNYQVSAHREMNKARCRPTGVGQSSWR